MAQLCSGSAAYSKVMVQHSKARYMYSMIRYGVAQVL